MSTSTYSPDSTHMPVRDVVVITDMAQRSILVILLAIPATLLSMLLPQTHRILTIAGIWLVVAGLVEVLQYTVNFDAGTISIRRLWWGRWQRRRLDYSFDDVRSLRYSEFGDGFPGYRWEFHDGRTFHLLAPIDPRLLEMFPAAGNRRRETLDNWLAAGAMLVAFLIGTGLTVYVDAIVGWNIFRQIQSADFPTVTGQLLKSDAKLYDDSGDAALWNYEPDLAYSYTIDGREYQGTRFRYGAYTMWRSTSTAVTNQLPRPGDVTVFYNPHLPADAILSPGITGSDIFIPLCLLPFNAMVLIGLLALLQFLRRRSTHGLCVRDNGRVALIGVSRWSPAVAALAATGAMASLLVFAIGVPTGGGPSPLVSSIGWLLAASAGALAWFVSVRVLATGTRDLVVDREHQTLTLPVSWGRKAPLTIPWSSLSGIEVDDVNNQSETVHYAAVAVVRNVDGTSSRELLSDLQRESQATALAALTRQLLPSPSVHSGNHSGSTRPHRK